MQYLIPTEPIFSAIPNGCKKGVAWALQVREKTVSPDNPLVASLIDSGDIQVFNDVYGPSVLVDDNFNSRFLSGNPGLFEVWQSLREMDLLPCSKNAKGAKLRGFKLDGCDFTGFDLRGANLDRTIGHEVSFRHADLREASLVLADLPGCDFSFAKMGHAKMKHATLHAALFEAADMSDVDARKANMNQAYLRNTNLSRSRLHDAQFDLACLTGAKTHHARMDEVNYLAFDCQTRYMSIASRAADSAAHAEREAAAEIRGNRIEPEPAKPDVDGNVIPPEVPPTPDVDGNR